MRWNMSTRGRLLPILFALLFSSALLTGFFYLKYRPPYGVYKTLIDSEVAQSQTRIQGLERQNKYVFFRQLQGAGFNNQAQEILLFHHLALLTSRIYVYQPFVWNPRKAFLPLSAFLLGPTKGSISSAIFDQVCPPEDVKHVSITGQHNEIWRQAQDILNGADRCVVVDNWILNWQFLASSAIHDIWPSFQKYLSSHFAWPNAMLDMANRSYSELNLRSKPSGTDGEPYMAIHFRRGDFEEHCHTLTGTGFTTWATLPILRDSIFPPALDVANATSVMEHCYSSLYRILDAIDMNIRTRPHLRALYVLHDGAWDHPMVYIQFYKLETALKDSKRARRAGWAGTGGMKLVTHSGMLPVHRGERDWKVAVDVELARNAEVFIGNGYSSLTSQIVALRLADGGRTQDITLL